MIWIIVQNLGGAGVFIPAGRGADATLGRLVHNAYKIKMKGESMRKWYAKKDDVDMMEE